MHHHVLPRRNEHTHLPTLTACFPSCKKWIESIQTEISCTVKRAGKCMHSFHTLMYNHDYLPKTKSKVTNTKTKYQLPAAIADDDWLNWTSEQMEKKISIENTHTLHTLHHHVLPRRNEHTQFPALTACSLSCKNWIESIQTEIRCTVQRAGKCMHSFHTTTRLPSSTTYWIRQGRILTTSCNGRRRLTELNIWANEKNQSALTTNTHTTYTARLHESFSHFSH